MQMLSEARESAVWLAGALRKLSREARDIADEMDFTFLLDKQRLLMSVGFDAQSNELQPYFYDLLATRTTHRCFRGYRQR